MTSSSRASQKKPFRRTTGFAARKPLKGAFLQENGNLYFSLSKKCVFRAVDRNRLRRWGREEWRKTALKTGFLLIFQKTEGDFYRRWRRKEFNEAFHGLIQKLKPVSGKGDDGGAQTASRIPNGSKEAAKKLSGKDAPPPTGGFSAAGSSAGRVIQTV